MDKCYKLGQLLVSTPTRPTEVAGVTTRSGRRPWAPVRNEAVSAGRRGKAPGEKRPAASGVTQRAKGRAPVLGLRSEGAQRPNDEGEGRG